jgi:hypothetical protein
MAVRLAPIGREVFVYEPAVWPEFNGDDFAEVVDVEFE